MLSVKKIDLRLQSQFMLCCGGGSGGGGGGGQRGGFGCNATLFSFLWKLSTESAADSSVSVTEIE